MIKATSESADGSGRPLLILGLSQRDMQKLRAGATYQVEAGGLDVFIVGGETDEAIETELRATVVQARWDRTDQ